MKQVNLRIYRTILTLLLGLFLSAGAYAQQISVKGTVKDQTGLYRSSRKSDGMMGWVYTAYKNS